MTKPGAFIGRPPQPRFNVFDATDPVRLSVEHGADPNLTMANGATVVFRDCSGTRRRDRVSGGTGSLDAEDDQEQTPVDIAD